MGSTASGPALSKVNQRFLNSLSGFIEYQRNPFEDEHILKVYCYERMKDDQNQHMTQFSSHSNLDQSSFVISHDDRRKNRAHQRESDYHSQPLQQQKESQVNHYQSRNASMNSMFLVNASGANKTQDYIKIESHEHHHHYDPISDEKGYFQPAFMLFSATQVKPTISERGPNFETAHIRQKSQVPEHIQIKNFIIDSLGQQSIENPGSVEGRQLRKSRLMIEQFSEEQGSAHSFHPQKTPSFLINPQRFKLKTFSSEYLEESKREDDPEEGFNEQGSNYCEKFLPAHKRTSRKQAYNERGGSLVQEESIVQSVIVTSKYHDSKCQHSPQSILHNVQNDHHFVFSNLQSAREEN